MSRADATRLKGNPARHPEFDVGSEGGTAPVPMKRIDVFGQLTYLWGLQCRFRGPCWKSN